MKFLVYRELIRSRRVVLFSYDAAIAGGVLFILIALSFRVGNLALLPQFIRDTFSQINNSVSLPMLALLSGITMTSAVSSDTEEWELWRKCWHSIKFCVKANPIGQDIGLQSKQDWGFPLNW